MSAATGHSLNLMACVRESSPQEPPPDADQASRQEGKRRRFHPLRGLRRMFRRKAAPAGGGAAGSAAGGCRSDEEDAHHHHLHDHHHAHHHHHHHHHHADGAPLDQLQQEQLRCRSASELLAAEGPTARRRWRCHATTIVSDSVNGLWLRSSQGNLAGYTQTATTSRSCILITSQTRMPQSASLLKNEYTLKISPLPVFEILDCL
ncbi:uncharacterized protein LOC126095640 [Schistocerca cancellata]|uniref:uncharacterized protein LOC126095640 n=1 Tax=Schistocerca cancellata TaxID=274614 RepID=UPI002118F1B6|nr:uncharacterized protein LOC126095640 [Schistocerca cancellata]